MTSRVVGGRLVVARISRWISQLLTTDVDERPTPSALGVRTEVAERRLNHKLPGIQSVYHTRDYFAERRAALESWTALLLDIERGER
jgi:hypothetical protein